MSTTSATPETIFMLRISLKHIKPEVWRRVLVPGDYTFKDLHDVVMAVMGWSDFHMHKFTMDHPVTNQEIEIGGVGDLGYGDYLWLPESSTKIAHYLLNPNQKAVHEYDFGSPWYHIIVFEKTIPAIIGEKYPKCIGGKKMPPPEDDPGSGYSDSEHLDKEFDHKRVNFRRCKQSVVQSPQNDKEVSKVATSSASMCSDVPVSKNLINKITSKTEGPTAKRMRRVIRVRSTSSAAASTIEMTHPRPVVPDVPNSSSSVSEMNASTESQIGKETEADVESYGKFIASQMMLIPDLKAREELRSVIQNTIQKYTTQKK